MFVYIQDDGRPYQENGHYIIFKNEKIVKESVIQTHSKLGIPQWEFSLSDKDLRCRGVDREGNIHELWFGRVVVLEHSTHL